MDIKKFTDGFDEKVKELNDLDKKQNKIIEEAKQVVRDTFDRYLEELKEQVKLMTRDDMQEYLNEASKRDHDIHMQAMVLYAFALTHEGRDRKVAENTLKILCMKMDFDDLSDTIVSLLI